MNRLFATFACLTLFAASATAQAIAYEDGRPGPMLQTWRSDDGRDLFVNCGPLSQSNGALILLGSFEGTLAQLGKGLPSVLACSSVIAITFTPGEELAIATRWPQVHVLLQAVEVSFQPFAMGASEVVQVGDGPITKDMLAAAKQARDDANQAADRNGDGIIDSNDWK